MMATPDEALMLEARQLQLQARNRLELQKAKHTLGLRRRDKAGCTHIYTTSYGQQVIDIYPEKGE